MVKALMFKLSNLLGNKKNKRGLLSLLIIICLIFMAFKPQEFVDLWLTPDQQGQLLFNHGKYELASKTFINTRWQAFSAYGSEDFNTAASLYSQFNDAEDLLAQANAFAHQRDYVKARNLYRSINKRFPKFVDAQTNLVIVQAIIDENNLLSESQKSEQGESSKELGDEPQSSEGAERKDSQSSELEQLSSEQLLLDDNLNKMWLRQVQKDPANFLSQKFHMQVDENIEKFKETKDKSLAEDNSNE